MKSNYIVWCPDSEVPPKRQFTSETVAYKIASEMSVKYKQTFYVAKLVGKAFCSVEKFT